MAWTLREYAGPGVYANPTDRSSIVRSEAEGAIRLASIAFRGQGTDSGLLLDDDAASRIFPALKVWRLEEDASGGAKILWRGRLMDVGSARGQHWIGDARQFSLGFVDSNWDLTKLRVEWSRGAETDVARLQALGAYILNGAASTVTNARERPSTVINVTTYVPNTNTVTMPIKEYSAASPLDVIEDCARASGKAYFVYLADDGTLYLFYDLDTSSALACTLSITDVAPDFASSFPPHAGDTGRDQDGRELLSGGAHVWGDGDVISDFDTTAETTYDVAEDTVYTDAETTYEATRKLSELLEERRVAEARVRTTMYLPSAQAHLVRAGMTISFRSAAAGLTSAATLRIVRAEPHPPVVAGGFYEIPLELAYPVKLEPRLQDRGYGPVMARKATGPFNGAGTPCVPVAGHSITGVASSGGNNNVPSPAEFYGPVSVAGIQAGDYIVVFAHRRDGSGSHPAGYTAHPSSPLQINNDRLFAYYRVANGTEGGSVPLPWVIADSARGGYEIAVLRGVDGAEFYATADVGNPAGLGRFFSRIGRLYHFLGGGITYTHQDPPPGDGSVFVGFGPAGDDFGAVSRNYHPVYYPAVGDAEDGPGQRVEPTDHLMWGTGAPNPGELIEGVAWAGMLFALYETTCTPPLGQQVINHPLGFGAPVGGLYDLFWPYSAGSLRVRVDGVDVTSEIQDTGPSTGWFTLSFDPEDDEDVRADYVAAAW